MFNQSERKAIFEEIMPEDFPELKKDLNLWIHEVQCDLNRINKMNPHLL